MATASGLRVGAALRGEPRDSYLLSTKVGRLLEPCAPGEEDSGFFISKAPADTLRLFPATP